MNKMMMIESATRTNNKEMNPVQTAFFLITLSNSSLNFLTFNNASPRPHREGARFSWM